MKKYLCWLFGGLQEKMRDMDHGDLFCFGVVVALFPLWFPFWLLGVFCMLILRGTVWILK